MQLELDSIGRPPLLRLLLDLLFYDALPLIMHKIYFKQLHSIMWMYIVNVECVIVVPFSG